MGVKRADKRRTGELSVEVGMKESFKKKLMRNRVIWTGRVEIMGDAKQAKRADTKKVCGKRRRERAKLRRRIALKET